MINDEADEVIEELFKLLKNTYQNNLESMKGSEFVFMFIYRIINIINLNRCGSYVDSPDWIKNKKRNNKCH